MSTPSTRRPWSDAQLTEAVKVSSSWRGVMRQLGLNATSAGAIRIVRRHAARLGLDTSHFRGKRRWSDAQLKRAVTQSRSWDEVLDALGLHLIPSRVIAGRVAILLRTYTAYIAGNASGLLGTAWDGRAGNVKADARSCA